jgi:FkbM family methyltransferase
LHAGGFDVEFPAPHCEDIDLGRRLSQRGNIVFNPSMRVVHPPRPIGFWEQASRGRLIESEWRLHTKHPETRPARWPMRWGPWVRMARRWQRRLVDDVITHRSSRRAIRTSALALAQLAVGLHTTATRWDARRWDSIRKRRSALRPIRNIVEEVTSFVRISNDGRSILRFASDSVAYRTLHLAPNRALGGKRTIVLTEGPILTYRRNRGDIQTIREVWLDNVYRLPIDFAPASVLDLGANIGLASVWFSHAYSSYVTAVEPLPANAEVARENFARNEVHGEIIQAAVGPIGGVGRMETGREPNLARLGARGVEVQVVGISSLLERLGHVDLVKLDIEGGEAALLEDTQWLDACQALIVEFHPAVVDRDELISTIVRRGFEFYPAGSVLPKTADFFARRGRG